MSQEPLIVTADRAHGLLARAGLFAEQTAANRRVEAWVRWGCRRVLNRRRRRGRCRGKDAALRFADGPPGAARR